MSTAIDGGESLHLAHPSALVVDNDEDVRPALCAMLEYIGFTTVAVDDAVGALALIEASGPFDLLLADVHSPGSMDGAALAAMARTLYPMMMILVITGLGGSAKEGLPQDIAILHKPLFIDDLKAHIDRLRRQH